MHHASANHPSTNTGAVVPPQHRVTPTAIHRLLYRIAGLMWFNRITIQHPQRLNTVGPTLFLGLHRNGVLDGIAYLEAVPQAAYLVSIQLHRSLLGRALFPGIAVAREKDRVRGIASDNAAANEQCVSHLTAGGQLFVMPEGTSSLGPRHLPFKPGAAHIAASVIRRGIPLTLVPLAIHYERAWEWQSRVEVVVGEPVTCTPGDEVVRDGAFGHMAYQINAALGRTGVNVESDTQLRLIESLAYLATLETGLSYAWCLKCLESGVPEAVRELANSLTALARNCGAWLHQDVPLLPTQSLGFAMAAWSVMVPVMAVFVMSNLPSLAAGRLAGKLLPDNRNVVGLWSAAVGFPVAVFWSAAMVISLAALGHGWLAGAYVLVSLLGVRLWREFRKQTVSVHNELKAPELRGPYFELRRRLREYLQGRLSHDA